MIIKGGHQQKDRKADEVPVDLFHKDLRSPRISNGGCGAVKIRHADTRDQNQQEE
jgi:hypothetical protein